MKSTCYHVIVIGTSSGGIDGAVVVLTRPEVGGHRLSRHRVFGFQPIDIARYG